MTDNSKCIPAAAARQDWRDMLLDDYRAEIVSLEDQLVSARQDAEVYRLMTSEALTALACLIATGRRLRTRNAALLVEVRSLRKSRERAETPQSRRAA